MLAGSSEVRKAPFVLPGQSCDPHRPTLGKLYFDPWAIALLNPSLQEGKRELRADQLVCWIDGQSDSVVDVAAIYPTVPTFLVGMQFRHGKATKNEVPTECPREYDGDADATWYGRVPAPICTNSSEDFSVLHSPSSPLGWTTTLETLRSSAIICSGRFLGYYDGHREHL